MINSLLPEIPELETTNYRLRPVTKDDAEMLFPILSNKETMKYITPTPVVSLEELIGNIEAYLNNFDKRKEIPWVIIEKNREKVIGLFRLHKIHL